MNYRTSLTTLTHAFFLRLLPFYTIIFVLSLTICGCTGGSSTSTVNIISSTRQAPVSGSTGGVIAYSSRQGADWQIILMNTDGSDPRNLTASINGGYEPNWSPDGTQIVYQNNGLWILDVTTGGSTRLPTEVENPYVVKPSWSPDGEWIAFLNEDGYRGDIYLIHPDGTGLTRVTTSADVSRDGNLAWSPDSQQIAFSAQVDGNTDIFLVDLSGLQQGTGESSRKNLTNSQEHVTNLLSSWSADGTRIAFSSDRDGNTEIYIMNSDGSSASRLTTSPFSDNQPSFSPDGRSIVFSSNREGGDLEIYLLTIESALQDSSEVTRLTEHTGEDVGPVWGPIP